MNTNKRATESFIVNIAGQTTMPTSGTVSDSTTLNVNLANGRLGVVSDSIYGSVARNTFTDATPTIAEAPVIAIYQGTANSASMATATATYPLSVIPYERTNPIDGRSSVKVTKQLFRDPAHSTWVIGGAEGNTDDINVLDDTTYSVSIALRGRRIQESHGCEEAATLHASVTTPDFTDLGYTNAQAIDYIVTYLAWNINRNSYLLNMNSRFPAKWPVLALLIDTTGTSGTAIGGAGLGGGSTAIVAGDVVPVANTSTGVRSITLTEAMAASIKAAAVAAFGDVIANVTWTIVPIDLSEAGEVASAPADCIMLLGLDEQIAYEDWIPQVKTRLQVGLTAGFDFNTVLNTEYVFSDEGQGQSRPLDILYKNTQGQRKYNLKHTDSPVINYPSPIVDGQQYVVYNINHGRVENVDTFNNIYSPYREIICLPRYSSGTTTNALISTFDGVLNNWLSSSSNPAIASIE